MGLSWPVCHAKTEQGGTAWAQRHGFMSSLSALFLSSLLHNVLLMFQPFSATRVAYRGTKPVAYSILHLIVTKGLVLSPHQHRSS